MRETERGETVSGMRGRREAERSHKESELRREGIGKIRRRKGERERRDQYKVHSSKDQSAYLALRFIV